MAAHVRGPEASEKQHVRLVAVEEVMLDPALQDVSEWGVDLSEADGWMESARMPSSGPC